MTGSGDTVTLTRVPVATSSGQIVYQDITLLFDNDGSGNGKYAGPESVANGHAAIAVSGPGVVGGGSTASSSSSVAGADSRTFPVSANWYVGSISNNPMATRLTKAGITFASFTNNGFDQTSPVDQITYTLSQ